jgi:hypothetical protein
MKLVLLLAAMTAFPLFASDKTAAENASEVTPPHVATGETVEDGDFIRRSTREDCPQRIVVRYENGHRVTYCEPCRR